MGSATPGGHRPARLRGRWALLLLAGLSMPVASACGATTPLCNSAATLLQDARLDDGAITYARADAQGEGDCASAGLDAAGSAYQEAAVNVARGRAAENVKDVDGAVSAYEAAVQVDRANPAAADGLKRLGRPVPALRPTVVEPAVFPVAVSVPWWPFVTAGALLVAAIVASWWWARWMLGRRETTAEERARQAVQPLKDAVDTLQSRTEEIRSDLAAVSTRTEDLTRGLGLTGTDATSEPREGDAGGQDEDGDAAEVEATAARPPTLAAQIVELRDRVETRAREESEWRRRMEGHLDDVVDHLDGSPRNGAAQRQHFTRTES